MTSNMPSVMNGGKDFCNWSFYDRTLANVIDKPIELALGKYGKGFANIALAESLFEKGGDDYEIMTLLNKGRYQAEHGGKLEMCFVAIGILIRMEIFKGQIKNAYKLLLDFNKKLIKEDAMHLMSNLKALECRLALKRGDKNAVCNWLEDAPQENIEFCIMYRYIYLTKVRVYLLQEEWEPAFALLQRLLYYAETYDRTYIRMECTLLLSIYQYRCKKREWRTTFQQLLSETEHYGFIPLIAEEGDAVLPLLQKCDHKHIGSAYYEQVLQATLRMAKQYPAYLAWAQSDTVELPLHALEILQMQSEGKTAKAIAEALHITEATVRYHSKNTYHKLGASGKMDAVRIAKEMKLI